MGIFIVPAIFGIIVGIALGNLLAGLVTFVLWLPLSYLIHRQAEERSQKRDKKLYEDLRTSDNSENDFNKECNNQYEPSKQAILEALLRTNAGTIMRKQIRDGRPQGDLSVTSNPFNPSDTQLLTETILGARNFDLEKIDKILIRILGKDYNRRYEIAKQELINQVKR